MHDTLTITRGEKKKILLFLSNIQILAAKTEHPVEKTELLLVGYFWVLLFKFNLNVKH